MPTGKRIETLVGKAGQNVVEHVPFANVRRPAELSKLVGVDVRGFKHSVSNQAIQHAIGRHGVPSVELQRGQRTVTAEDFQRLPDVVRAVPTLSPVRGKNGQPRLVYRANIEGISYTYVAEVRAGKKRLDAVTMYKK